MADQRSVMKEYRLLEQKRQGGGLSPQEEARFAQLRDLVGTETGMGASKAGFDVNAAAARLRESLLPAGLRNRPPPEPEAAPEPPPEPEPEAAPAGETGLEAVWNAAPFAPLAPTGGLSADALFDPGTLGNDAPAEAAWDPNAQPYDAGAAAYDPNAQPYDPSAQSYDPNQPYDPNAPPYDPNAPQAWDAGAQGWDPNAQPYDPNAPAYDPSAQPYDAGAAAYDPNAQPYDLNATQAWDAGAQGWDPNAQPYDPAAPAYDPNAQAYDPNAQPYDPDAQPYDPNAAPQWDAATQAAWDPNLAEPWTEQATGEPAAEPSAEPAAEPAAVGGLEGGWAAQGLAAETTDAPQSQPWETEPSAEDPSPVEPAAVEPAAWEASALPPEEQAAPEPAWDAGLVAPDPLAEPSLEPELEAAAEPEPATGLEPEPELAAEAAAEPEAVTEDAIDVPTDDLLPFDSGESVAVEIPATPEDWGAVEPTLEAAASESTLGGELGGYGDLAAPEEPAHLDTLTTEDAQGLLAPLPAGQELTSDDDAFAQGFQLESNGSFGQAAAATTPTWGEQAASSETEAWESAPSLDLASMGSAGEVPPLDLAPPALEELDEVDVEELPIVDGTDLLEELPAEPVPAATAAPLLSPAAEIRIEGTHRVVVHTVEGLVKRGVITDVSLDDDALPLAAQPDAQPEALPAAKVKAIFFMLAAGEKAPAAEGKKVRVTFNDGRQIAGFSPDYSESGPGFFMIPADTRTNTGRIWVYRAAVKSVSVS